MTPFRFQFVRTIAISVVLVAASCSQAQASIIVPKGLDKVAFDSDSATGLGLRAESQPSQPVQQVPDSQFQIFGFLCSSPINNQLGGGPSTEFGGGGLQVLAVLLDQLEFRIGCNERVLIFSSQIPPSPILDGILEPPKRSLHSISFV